MSIYALGLMSGTSMDGIDIALINPLTHQLIDAQVYSYSHNIEQRLRQVMQGHSFDMHFFARLDRDVGLEFAAAASQFMSKQSADVQENLKVIGMHGQTICHDIQINDAYTWQIGSPFPLYEILNRPVVYDFRSKNVAQGGQGAPLAPIYHQAIFDKYKPAVVVNIGGISNISCIIGNQPLYGFDIGPGNCLMDAWIHTQLGLTYDKDSAWAMTGRICQALVNRLLTDPYFHQLPPKSIGKEYFSLTWLQDYLLEFNLNAEDIQATLCYFSALLIANTVNALNQTIQQVFICGGGSKNKALMQYLKDLLTNVQVMSTDEIGVSADYLEAMMMAYLAWLRIDNKPLPLGHIMGGRDQQLHGIICE
ncbi:MAG: anhydro-N-acetylmuramic acid kinase [Gammaproteobacteria bacterium]|nr:anhydro-N-acetylmuramic acid kinase [Gammaproteobacteria bacterium]